MIPTFRTVLPPSAIQAVTRVLRSGWLTSGPEVVKFEQVLAKYFGFPFAVAVASCTQGLTMVLRCLIQPGEKVATTPLTFVATINAIIRAGGVPVLFDVDQEGLLTDTWIHDPLIKVVVPVHYGGRLWEVPRTLSTDREDVVVVVDGAHACHPKLPNTYTSVLSFHATKGLTTGHGGAVLTSNWDFVHRLRSMRMQGATRGAWAKSQQPIPRFDVLEPGDKANLTDFQAAMGRAQLAGLRAGWQRRRAIAKRYTEAFHAVSRLQCPTDAPGHGWHLYTVRLREATSEQRDAVILTCAKQGVQLGLHNEPVHWLTAYRLLYRAGSLPNAEAWGRTCLTLPCYPSLTDQEQATVIKVLKAAL